MAAILTILIKLKHYMCSYYSALPFPFINSLYISLISLNGGDNLCIFHGAKLSSQPQIKQLMADCLKNIHRYSLNFLFSLAWK